MSATINDGGPAFPRTYSTNYLSNSCAMIETSGGMSLRDWFAGQALAGMMAHPDTAMDPDNLAHHMAQGPWAIADAMLAARSKGGAA